MNKLKFIFLIIFFSFIENLNGMHPNEFPFEILRLVSAGNDQAAIDAFEKYLADGGDLYAVCPGDRSFTFFKLGMGFNSFEIVNYLLKKKFDLKKVGQNRNGKWFSALGLIIFNWKEGIYNIKFAELVINNTPAEEFYDGFRDKADFWLYLFDNNDEHLAKLILEKLNKNDLNSEIEFNFLGVKHIFGNLFYFALSVHVKIEFLIMFIDYGINIDPENALMIAKFHKIRDPAIIKFLENLASIKKNIKTTLYEFPKDISSIVADYSYNISENKPKNRSCLPDCNIM